MGFKIEVLGAVKTYNFGAPATLVPFGCFGPQKGIKTDGFQNGKF